MNTFIGFEGSAKDLNLLDPTPDAIEILPMLYALDKVNRFAGRGTGEISVLRHSLHVMGMYDPNDENGQCLAVLHDAHEAFTGEITKPMKNAVKNLTPGLMDIIGSIEFGINQAIFAAIGFEPSSRSLMTIKDYDRRALMFEKYYLKISPHDDWGMPHLYDISSKPKHQEPLIAIQSYPRETAVMKAARAIGVDSDGAIRHKRRK